MRKVYNAKSITSGNSVAILIPATLGIEPDREWMISEQGAGFLIRPKPQLGDRIDISGFAGKCPGLEPIAREDFEERPSTISAREVAARDSKLGE